MKFPESSKRYQWPPTTSPSPETAHTSEDFGDHPLRSMPLAIKNSVSATDPVGSVHTAAPLYAVWPPTTEPSAFVPLASFHVSVFHASMGRLGSASIPVPCV